MDTHLYLRCNLLFILCALASVSLALMLVPFVHCRIDSSHLFVTHFISHPSHRLLLPLLDLFRFVLGFIAAAVHFRVSILFAVYISLLLFYPP